MSADLRITHGVSYATLLAAFGLVNSLRGSARADRLGLTMRRWILVVSLLSTTDARKLEFEAAAIKAGDPSVYSSLQINNDNTVSSKSVTLRNMIEAAFDLFPFQLSGGPRWMDSDRFAIQAKAPGVASKEQLRLMLQTLLAERFGVQLRREVKMQNTLVLRQKDPKKVKEKLVSSSNGRMGLGARTSPTGDVQNEVKGYTMAMLATTLAREAQNVVVDETGLIGAFDFVFTATHEAEQANPFVTPWAPAMGELGLKLEQGKGPVEYFVVERAELPTEN